MAKIIGNATATLNTLTEERVVELISETTPDTGATFTPSVSEDGVISWTNDKGLENPEPVNISGPQGEQGPKGDTGATGKSAYDTAKEGGYIGTEEQFANKLAETPYKISVKEYGAKGDGATNDTAAFQNALANNRVVYVPGGDYILNDTLIIRENCELELAQDAVLNFTQTSGNAITLLRLASLRGNHATIFVPYTFSGNVINADTRDDSAALGDFSGLTGEDLNSAVGNANNAAVPPFKKWDPMWRMSRYITDINICKKNSSGFCYSNDGTCYGTAVNLHCDSSTRSSYYYKWTYMWGVSMSGIRISGGFNYGIHAHNTGDHDISWNHDMRIEAVIERCKIGVLIDNCYYSRFAVTVQPKQAQDGTVYAENGIKIVNSKGIDLTSSRVWDWYSMNDDGSPKETKWIYDPTYRHIALIGDCSGLLLDDYFYYVNSTDIRELIYTDTPSNLERMTILQEPITRWFKPKDGAPHFSDGYTDYRLSLKEDIDSLFDTEEIADFTDALVQATDVDGTIYNGVGYKNDARIVFSDGVTIVPSTDGNWYYTTTGFIPCKKHSTINMKHLRFSYSDGWTGLVLYDASRSKVLHVTQTSMLTSSYIESYSNTNNGCSITLSSSSNLNNVAYVRFVFHKVCVGDYPMIAVDQDLTYSSVGVLADTVKVTDDNIESTKLNALQTQVNGFEQSFTDGLNELETGINKRFDNLSISPTQTNFIVSEGGESIQKPLFTDQLVVATDVDGSIYNGIGYKKGARVVLASGNVEESSGTSSMVATGFMRCENNQKIYMEDIDLETDNGYVGVVFYDEDLVRIQSLTATTIRGGSYYGSYEKTSTGCIVTGKNISTLHYVRFTFDQQNFGSSPKIAIGEEIKYDEVWQGEPQRLKDTIYAQNVFLTSPSGNTFTLAVGDDGVLTATAYTG